MIILLPDWWLARGGRTCVEVDFPCQSHVYSIHYLRTGMAVVVERWPGPALSVPLNFESFRANPMPA